MIFSANMLQDVRHEMIDLLGIRESLDSSFYLGLPSQIGRKKKEVMGHIKDRVWSHLNS